MRKTERIYLLQKKYLTIPEAMKLMDVGRDRALSLIGSGEWTPIKFGARTKVSTASIRKQVDKETREQRERVGLDTPAFRAGS